MIAYNRAGLDALLTRDFANQWHEKGLLSGERRQAIQDQNPVGFYSPNVFVRIGLAVFCLILLLAMMGLAGLIVEPRTEAGLAIFSIFWGVVWLWGLENIVIRRYRHYGSGLDDMLLYAGTMAIYGGICSQLPSGAWPLGWYFVALPFLVAGSIRYLDRLMALAAVMCALLIVVEIVRHIPGLALYLLPFSGMLFSAGVWYFARNRRQRVDLRHWDGVLLTVELLCLLIFYASGNYWVVQQAGAAWFSLEQAPFPWFFWTFTFAVPGLYIFRGLRRKDRLMLDAGIGCAVAAIVTFRYYHHVLPLAWAAAIGGTVLFIIAYLSIRYLRKNQLSYTYEADGKITVLQQAGEHIFEHTIAGESATTPPKKENMGGGQFGGGGSGGDF